MGFLLTTDTSCDWFKSQLKMEGIPYIPLTFTVDGVVCPDEFDSDAEYKDFYDRIRQGAMPTTSQINPEVHQEFFLRLIKEGAKEIVHLTLSSGLSNTYQSACIAAKEAMSQCPDSEIHIIDTISATQAHGLLLFRAKQMRDGGLTAAEAAARLNEIKQNFHGWILADDLMHLRRGGRVNGAAAVIGTVLNIKPILILNRLGGLSVVHKSKGLKKALNYIFERFLENCPDYKTADVWIASGDCADKAEQFLEMMRAHGCTGEVRTGWIGPIIGAHTGLGTLGVVFEGKPRTQ